MITQYELEEFQRIPVKEVDINKLYEVKEIKIDESLPVCERIKTMLEMYENPYFHRDDKVKVKSSFQENGMTLLEKLEIILGNVSCGKWDL